jgi:hypothetical protein
VAVWRAVFSIGIGLALAACGYWLAFPDLQSLFFVTVACMFWLAWVAGTAIYVRGLTRAERVLASARGVEALVDTSWAGWAEAVRGMTLTEPGQRPRRTSSATKLLAAGSPGWPEELTPGSWLPAGQAVLVSIGLLGTFYGLSSGLASSIPCIDPDSAEHAACVAAAVAGTSGDVDSDTLAMQAGMSDLLNGARTAFSKSVAGIGLGMSFMLLWRLAERRRAHVLRRAGALADSWYDYVSPEQLAAERHERLATELRALRDAQPDGTALTAAASRLGLGARSLSEVAERLGSVSHTLEGFRAETIAREVAAGVRSAVEERLAPTLEEISTELRVLHEMKRETDEAVTRQLAELVARLRDEALLPIKQEVQLTNAETRKVAAAVVTLGDSVIASSHAVRETSTQVAGLTERLSDFQQDALSRLRDFADSLRATLGQFTTDTTRSFEQIGANIHDALSAAERAMGAQRVAFEASAEEARGAFRAQTDALKDAGEAASTQIKGAGAEASAALRLVRTEFAHALSSQREALQEVLEALTTAFRQDLAERERFEALTSQAIAKVEKLLALAAIQDTTLRSATSEAAHVLTRQLVEMNRQTSLQRDALDQLRTALGEHLSASADAHHKFLTREDQHLSEILEKVAGMMAEVHETARMSAARRPTEAH